LLLPLSLLLSAQSGASPALNVEPPAKLLLTRGQSAPLPLKLKLAPGFHVHSNKPNDPYLIPIRLTWDARPLSAGDVQYPAPETEKSEFSDKPLLVYSNAFQLTTSLTAPASAPTGLGIALGKLRYQACNNKMCFPPRTIEIRVPFEVR
jgi:thioredoxin:protein disulfide reductase